MAPADPAEPDVPVDASGSEPPAEASGTPNASEVPDDPVVTAGDPPAPCEGGDPDDAMPPEAAPIDPLSPAGVPDCSPLEPPEAGGVSWEAPGVPEDPLDEQATKPASVNIGSHETRSVVIIESSSLRVAGSGLRSRTGSDGNLVNISDCGGKRTNDLQLFDQNGSRWYPLRLQTHLKDECVLAHVAAQL